MSSIHTPLPEVYERVARMEFLSRLDLLSRRLEVLDATLVRLHTALQAKDSPS